LLVVSAVERESASICEGESFIRERERKGEREERESKRERERELDEKLDVVLQ
jgi:hypothetical protein